MRPKRVGWTLRGTLEFIANNWGEVTMRHGLRLRGFRLALAALVAVAGTSAGIAYATGAIATGTATAIVGCAKNDNGQLRIVDSAAQCLPSEHVVNLAAPQAPPGPAAVVVDCAAGQTVGQALADNATATSLDITIKGTCTESVNVNRDDVSLHGAAAGDGLQAPSSGATVLQIASARQVRLSQLTVTGGGNGISIGGAALVFGDGVVLKDAAYSGMIVANSSTAFMNNLTVDHSHESLSVGGGGSLGVNGGTIENGVIGANVNGGGTLFLGGGVVVTGMSFIGVHAAHGGSATLQDATVQQNAQAGVAAFQGGTVFVTNRALVRANGNFGVSANAATADVEGHVTGNGGCGVCGYNGGHITVQNGALIDGNHGDGAQIGVGSSLATQHATIKDNGGNGISLQGTSTAAFGNGSNTITGNGGWGVFCEGPPAVAQIQAPQPSDDISGNAAGQISCPET